MKAKIKNYFLIFVIFQIALSPLSTAAQETHINDFKGIEATLGDVSCYLDVSCWVKKAMAWAGYYILSVINIFLWLSVQIFDLSAKLSLSQATYSKNTAVAVYAGWKLTRDFMNLFFIFILLFIAISIILQLHTYGSQKTLLRLIGVAIFINFSFFITQQVILASNSMALYFSGSFASVTPFSSEIVNAINPTQTLKGQKMDPKYLQKAAEDMFKINKQKQCEKSADDVFGKFGSKDPLGLPAWNNAVKTCLETYKAGSPVILEATEKILTDQNISWISILITIFGGIVIILTMAFIFLAAALMFLFRTVVLWILIILSPIAFLAFAVPGAESTFRRWWNRLFKEAFFAPTMMFMLFLVNMIITKKDAGGLTFLQRYVLQGNTTTLGNSFVFNFHLMAQFAMLLILLGMSLVIARSLGAHGASMAVNYGSKAAYWAGGKAGRVATSPIRGAGSAARKGVSEKARSIAEGESALRHIPGMKALSRAVVSSERGKVAEHEKQWSNRTDAEIAADLNSTKPMMTRERMMGELSVLAKRGRLDLVGENKLKQIHGYMSGLGMDTKAIETYMPSLAKDDQARERAIQNQRPENMGAILKNKEQFASQKDAAGNIVTPNKNQKDYEKYWGAGHLEEADKAARTETGNERKESLKEFFDTIIHEYATGTKKGADVKMDDIIGGLEARGNFKLANALKTEEGEKVFKQYATDGSAFQTGSHVAQAEARQILQREDKEVAETIKKGGTAASSEKDKKKTKEIINAADTKRLASLLEEMTSIQKRQLRAMLKTENPKLEQKVAAAESERNKQVLQFDNKDAAERIKDLSNKANAATGDEQEALREDIKNLINTADDKKLSAILNAMANTAERKSVKTTAEAFDPKLSERIVKIMPELEDDEAKRIKAFGQMRKEDIEKFDYNGLANRASAADLERIVDNMIQGFNPAHLRALSERGDDMMKAVMDNLTDNRTKNSVAEVVVKLEGLGKQDLANYLKSNSTGAGLLGLQT